MKKSIAAARQALAAEQMKNDIATLSEKVDALTEVMRSLLPATQKVEQEAATGGESDKQKAGAQGESDNQNDEGSESKGRKQK